MKWNVKLYQSLACVLVTGVSSFALGQSESHSILNPVELTPGIVVLTHFYSKDPSQTKFPEEQCDDKNNCKFKAINTDALILECGNPKANCHADTSKDAKALENGFVHVEVRQKGTRLEGWLGSEDIKNFKSTCLPCEAKAGYLRLKAASEEILDTVSFTPRPNKREIYFSGSCPSNKLTADGGTLLEVKQVRSVEGAEYCQVTTNDGDTRKPTPKKVINGKPPTLCKIDLPGKCGDQIDLAKKALGSNSNHQLCNMALEQFYNTCDVWNSMDLDDRKAMALREVNVAFNSWHPVSVPRNPGSQIPQSSKSAALKNRSVMSCLIARENPDFEPFRVNYTACRNGKSSAVGLTQLTSSLIDTLEDGGFLDHYCTEFGNFWQLYGKEKCVEGRTSADVFKQIKRDPALQIAVGIIALNYKIRVSKSLFKSPLSAGLEAWYGAGNSDNAQFSSHVESCISCINDRNQKDKMACLDLAIDGGKLKTK